MASIRIGITDCGRYENYANWIEAGTEGLVKAIRLTASMADQLDTLELHGILLTGGQDVHPRYYNRLDYMEFYKGTVPDIDEERDAFEWKVLQYVERSALPLLGICRGLQLTNVYFGGTLVLDIPSIGNENHSKIKEGQDRYHDLAVTAGSALMNISGIDTGVVNSAHHQSAMDVAPELLVAAVSPDGIIEALERKNFHDHPYLLLVQWHPERMTDQESPFAFKLKQSFIQAVRSAAQVTTHS